MASECCARSIDPADHERNPARIESRLRRPNPVHEIPGNGTDGHAPRFHSRAGAGSTGAISSSRDRKSTPPRRSTRKISCNKMQRLPTRVDFLHQRIRASRVHQGQRVNADAGGGPWERNPITQCPAHPPRFPARESGFRSSSFAQALRWIGWPQKNAERWRGVSPFQYSFFRSLRLFPAHCGNHSDSFR